MIDICNNLCELVVSAVAAFKNNIKNSKTLSIQKNFRSKNSWNEAMLFIDDY